MCEGRMGVFRIMGGAPRRMWSNPGETACGFEQTGGFASIVSATPLELVTMMRFIQ